MYVFCDEVTGKFLHLSPTSGFALGKILPAFCPYTFDANWLSGASALVVALEKEAHKTGSSQGLSTHADRRGDKSPG